MKSIKNLFTVCLILTSLPSLAQGVKNLKFSTSMSEGASIVGDDAYYSIESVELELVKVENELDGRSAAAQIGATLKVIDKMIATGEKIWKIVEAGKPVVNYGEIAPLNVLPAGLDGKSLNSDELENWSYPSVATYKMVFKNPFGMEVVKYNFSVSYQYGGTYKGNGRYLSSVSLQAKNLEVMWGYNLDAAAQLVSITNRGTKDKPVAGATLRLDYTVSTVVKTIKTGIRFYIDGNGKFLNL